MTQAPAQTETTMDNPGLKASTSDEYIARMLHALPFADNNAGLDETAALIRLLQDERNNLKRLLTDAHRDWMDIHHAEDAEISDFIREVAVAISSPTEAE